MSINVKDMMSLIRSLPKIDLHRHLVGSIRVETLLNIAQDKNLTLPTYDLTTLKKLIGIEKPTTSLRDFLKPLNILGLCYCDKPSIKRIAYEAVEDAAADNVKYLELAIGPAYEASFHNLSLEDVIEAIIDGVETAEEKYDIKVNLGAGPTFRWKERGRASSTEVLEAVTKFKQKIAYLGLSAESKEGVPFSQWEPGKKKEYVGFVQEAKDMGFPISVHAGEVCGPESVEDAIKILKADRIGHGISIVQNQEILQSVAKNRIPLEVCISSNIKSGIVREICNHPIRQLYENGVVVTINTDDPTLCKATLSNEFNILIKSLNFSILDIKNMLFNSIASAFMNDKKKIALSKSFQQHFAEIEDPSKVVNNEQIK